MNKPAHSRQRKLRRWIKILAALLRDLTQKLLVILLLSNLLFSLCAFLGRRHWLFELTSHFRAQYLAFAIVCVGFFFLFQSRRWLIVATLCAAMNAALIVPWYVPEPLFAARPRSHNFRVLLMNVLWKNKQHAAVTEMIRAENPDLIVLQETDYKWKDVTDALRTSWPHEATAWEHDGRIVCFSRYEIHDIKTTVTRENFQGIVIKVKVQDQWISFVSIHPQPPVNPAFLRERNEQLVETADIIRRLPRPLILLGDLNSTLWTPYFTDLVNQTNLKVARKGFGILPTWSRLLPPALMLPVDHCLVSPDISVVNCRTGNDVGSDHLPLIVDLVIPQTN